MSLILAAFFHLHHLLYESLAVAVEKKHLAHPLYFEDEQPIEQQTLAHLNKQFS